MRRIPVFVLAGLGLAAPAPAQEVQLSAEEQAHVYALLAERDCPCGCDMTVAVCLVEDPTCRTSQGIAERILREYLASRPAGSAPRRTRERPASDRGRWYDEVAGLQLVYIYTSSGYREKRCLWLYEDGSFASTSFGGSVSSLGSTAFGDGGGRGDWGVRGNVLTLVGPDGGRAEYSMTIEDDFLYLDGDRYFRVGLDDETCR